MTRNNVRIAIRDSTDSHNVAFFDNKAGIKYKSANLQRFLAGSASILTLKYNSKDIDSIRSGCKLAFRYKARDYWLNVMSFEKKGFEVELTAYSLGLELNNETRGEHKPANAMSIAEYVTYYDPEHALTIGVNEVADKRIKLEWTGTDTILARLFSVANSFDAELDFNVELNDDYSLKRQVLNIYKKGNFGTNKLSQPVRVGKELKVINYSDNIKELKTAVRATGKDGLTIDGLNKKIYDNNKELLYYSSGMTVYAPQSRDRFPSVGKGSNDNWIVEDLGETQYETKEALWGYLYSEIQKKSLPEITYEVEGAIDAGIGDTQTLIDDKHFEPALYVQARVSELEDDILTGKVTKSTFINFERKYSQIADELQKQVNELVQSSTPYEIKVSSDSGTVFKNATGTSTFKAKLFKGEKEITTGVSFIWSFDGVDTPNVQYTARADKIDGTAVLIASAYIGNNEVATTEITLTNVNDGAQGKTSHIHFAYADDDKGTNFSLTDKNQQYQGYYSDYTEADSTDYKKYTWVDRLANVQIDQLNLIGAYNLTPQNATFDKTDYTLTSTTTTNTKDGFVQLQFFDAKNVVFTTFNFSEKVGKFAKSFKITKAYERFRIKINGNASDASVWCYDKDLIKLNTDYVLSGEVLSLSADGRGNGGKIRYLKIQEGKVATGFSKSPKDVDSDISKVTSEFKQTTDSIKASVSSLDKSTVKTVSLNLDNNGFVTKVGKTVNGNTFATMIAQDENDVQIIAKKMKVSGDMIVNGAITAEKLNINSLSALSAKLGDVTSGSITNAFSSGTRSGSIKIKDNIEITSTDTSNLLPEKAKENLALSTGSLTMNASTSSDEATHSMLIMPETIKYTKNNYDTTRGGTNGWSLTHNGYYSMLQVDMVWQNVRLNNTSNMPYGIKANYVRIGNLVTISVDRQITNVAVVTENNLANETIPEGFRPISQAHLTLTGNTGTTIDATCICHLNPDGTIRFTNNKTGNRVWTGTVTYTCVEPMPYVKDLNNGSTI